jgi:hypothetical protein
VKGKDLLRDFGITIKQYNEMNIQQCGLCSICGKQETAIDTRINDVRALAVDHNHETGKVRGLLCTNCNMMLGSAQDSIDILKSAITYLEKHSD